MRRFFSTGAHFEMPTFGLVMAKPSVQLRDILYVAKGPNLTDLQVASAELEAYVVGLTDRVSVMFANHVQGLILRLVTIFQRVIAIHAVHM